MNKNICSIGECMIELVNNKEENYTQFYAGDTFNFAFYFSKEKMNVDYLTAIGNCEFSNKFLKLMKKINISTNLVFKDKIHNMAIHILKRYPDGEKKFFYWRDNSAAYYFFNDIKKNLSLSILKKYQYIYFSGITLSIMNEQNLITFFNLIKKLKKISTTKIIFDLNIRNSRWLDKKFMKKIFTTYLKEVDILFASGEDMENLYKNSNISYFKKIIKKNRINHAIYRLNSKVNFSFYYNDKFMIKNKITKNVINTAGAGDAFNAKYLSSYFKNNNINNCLKEAHNLGSKIIKYNGALKQ